jgi:hypothetical protein
MLPPRPLPVLNELPILENGLWVPVSPVTPPQDCYGIPTSVNCKEYFHPVASFSCSAKNFSRWVKAQPLKKIMVPELSSNNITLKFSKTMFCEIENSRPGNLCWFFNGNV